MDEKVDNIISLEESLGNLAVSTPPPPANDEEDVQRQKIRGWLNRYMRIRMSDGRILVGTFVCTDKDANVILSTASELYEQDKGSAFRDPRLLGLVMIPGRHIISMKMEHVTKINTIQTGNKVFCCGDEPVI